MKNHTAIVNFIAPLAEAAGVPAQQLTLEVTESQVMHGVVRILDTLARLRLKGISLSIDDFGTGYSSLSYLKRFPVDVLKIDRSFVANVADRSDDRAVITAIVALAGIFDVKVVAEGIETEAQLTGELSDVPKDITELEL